MIKLSRISEKALMPAMNKFSRCGDFVYQNLNRNSSSFWVNLDIWVNQVTRRESDVDGKGGQRQWWAFSTFGACGSEGFNLESWFGVQRTCAGRLGSIPLLKASWLGWTVNHYAQVELAEIVFIVRTQPAAGWIVRISHQIVSSVQIHH